MGSALDVAVGQAVTIRGATTAGLRTIIVEAAEVSQLSVVVLHGYAMEPEALVPFASSIGVPARFHFLEGPHRAVPKGRAWWPLDAERRARALAAGPRELASESPEGILDARATLLAALEAVRADAPLLPLVIVGFSQGGMLALDTVLRAQPRVAALALLSSSRILEEEWRPLAPRLAGLPILVSHGARDEDLAFSAGEKLRDFCLEAGAHVTWVSFDGGHEIPLVVWRAVRQLLRSVSPAAPEPPGP